MRLLVTCAGEKAKSKLMGLLDAEDVDRAVYSAWALAQLPDPSVNKKAIRRLAVCGTLNQEHYQAGSGIQFRVSRDLYFQQVTSGPGYARHEGPVRIPTHLLDPFDIDKQEQAFAIRLYRSMTTRNPTSSWYHLGLRRWYPSHVGLLRVMAEEDPYLKALHVKGEKVPHFPHRESAAKEIAVLTGTTAQYIGLAGERLDNGDLPRRPYPRQNAMIADFVLARIVAAGMDGRPETDDEWTARNGYTQMVTHLVHEFGDELRDALMERSRHRKLTKKLKDTGIHPWAGLAN